MAVAVAFLLSVVPLGIQVRSTFFAQERDKLDRAALAGRQVGRLLRDVGE
jgi:hypothetical protein